MITNFYKDRNGWTGISQTPLGHGKHLRIATFKNRHSVMVTQVTTCVLGQGCTTFSSGTDYIDTPYSDATVRCTEKNIKAQHNKVLAQVDMHRKRALEHLDSTRFLLAA